MPDAIDLIYKGGGRFVTGTKTAWGIVERTFVADERVRAKITRRRSIRQNNLFHAACQRAFDNQQAGEKFGDWQELRDYLLVRVGWVEVERIDFPALPGSKRQQAGIMGPFVARLAEEKRRRHRTVVVSIDPKATPMQVVFKYPKSFAFEKCDSEEAGEIVNKAFHIICTEIVPGVTVEELMTMARGDTKRRAAA